MAHNGSKYTDPKAPGVAMSWLIASTATRDLIPIFATILSLTMPPTTTPLKRERMIIIDIIKEFYVENNKFNLDHYQCFQCQW